MIALPTKPDDQTRHAEHKLLIRLNEMGLGFKKNHGFWPEFIILGTRRDPSNYGDTKTGCAYDYVDYKNKFRMVDCPGTRFYPYVRGPVLPRFMQAWRSTQVLMAENDIVILPS